jgi:signal transduction histidine kinase/DNA-binding NarL/FixJ family response regulator/HPt (histidine-containing phosphotransfer) domain-containing protein
MLFTGLGLLAAMSVGIIMYVEYRNYIKNSYTATLTNVAAVIEKLCPELREPERLKDRAERKWFWERSRNLKYIKDSFSLAYIYYVEKSAAGYTFLMSSGIQENENEDWLGGPVWKNGNPVPEFILKAFDTGVMTWSSEPVVNEWGELVSVALPVFNGERLVGVLGVDYDITVINDQLRDSRVELGLSLVFAVITILVQAVVGARSVITPLREKEADDRTRLMMDATPMVCTFWDANGKAIDCNMEAARVFGFAEKSRFLAAVSELTPPFQPDGEPSDKKAQRLIRQTLESGRQKFVWMRNSSSGEPIPLETTLVRVPWKDSWRVAAYGRDLRESLANEQKIREAEKHVHVMFDATPLACSWRDEQGGMFDCNQEMLRMFGYAYASKEDFIARFPALSPEFQPDGSVSAEKAREHFARAMKEGHVRFEWMYMTDAGENLPVATIVVRIPWQDRHRLAVYSRDLREERAREKELREADFRSREMEIQARTAEAASRAKSDFLASMSHEIRTPLNVIIGMSEMMRTDNLDDTQTEFFSDIRKTSGALLQIINDILDFSKIEAGRFSLNPVHFNLMGLYDNAVSLNRFMAQHKGLEFRSGFSADVEQVVFGDDVRIRQILTNVLNNAVKYTKNGYIDFRVSRVEDSGVVYTVFRVEDTGIGIKKEDMPMLFDAFARFDADRNRGVGGSGLGLSICGSLVEMMGGKILVESEYGKGSVFTVMLPLPKGDPAQTRHALTRDVVKINAKAKILVVDDNSLNLKVALAHLAKHNIGADAVSSGEEALQKCSETRYDLIFMDHMMPGMDGIQTAAKLRNMEQEWCKSVPIVALTANAVIGAKDMYLKSGMNDYISKPISADELNTALARWLPDDLVFYEAAETLAQAGRGPADGEKKTESACVDRRAGLENAVNDEALYRQLLREFSLKHAGDADRLRQALAGGDAGEARRLAHTLKSAAAVIGAKTLSEAARRIETPLGVGDGRVDAALLSHLEGALSSVLEEISETAFPGAEPPKDAQALSGAETLDLLDTLEPLLQVGDTACLTVLEEKRDRFAARGENCRNIVALMENFDLPAAAEAVGALRRMLTETETQLGTGDKGE